MVYKITRAPIGLFIDLCTTEEARSGNWNGWILSLTTGRIRREEVVGERGLPTERGTIAEEN